MKLTTRLGTRTAINRNLEEARRVLREKRFHVFSFPDGPSNKNGFVAINWLTKPFMLPMLVLVRPRGSFLEVQFDDIHNQAILLKSLRATLWVPIHVGKTIFITKEGFKELISAEEHAEYEKLRSNT